MAISADVVWRCRVGGNDLNGGGFDASIVGAGTDYTEQDVAELSISDLATAGVSANVTSATGGFTAAMIGNSIWLVAGTGWTAGTYFITAVASSNAATLDRNCCTAAASNGNARLGGAFQNIQRTTLVGNVAGNTVMIRGQGSNDPIDIDYSTSTYWPGQGSMSYIGYNGRPKISHTGICFYNVSNAFFKHLYFVQISNAQSAYGVLFNAGSAEDCIFDSGGFDARQMTGSSANRCSFINTGTQLAGVNPTISIGNVSCVIKDCLIKDQRGIGIQADSSTSYIHSNIIQNCGLDGIQLLGTRNVRSGFSVMNNTIHANGRYGISLSLASNMADMVLNNNMITGHVAAGSVGINYAFAPVGYSNQRLYGNNFYGNTTNSNALMSASDTTLDPQYVNAPTDLTPTNTALRYLSGVGSL